MLNFSFLNVYFFSYLYKIWSLKLEKKMNKWIRAVIFIIFDNSVTNGNILINKYEIWNICQVSKRPFFGSLSVSSSSSLLLTTLPYHNFSLCVILCCYATPSFPSENRIICLRRTFKITVLTIFQHLNRRILVNCNYFIK